MYIFREYIMKDKELPIAEIISLPEINLENTEIKYNLNPSAPPKISEEERIRNY